MGRLAFCEIKLSFLILFLINTIHQHSCKVLYLFNRYTGGNTDTAAALRFARTNLFTTTYGMRPNAAHIAIVVTDGK